MPNWFIKLFWLLAASGSATAYYLTGHDFLLAISMVSLYRYHVVVMVEASVVACQVALEAYDRQTTAIEFADEREFTGENDHSVLNSHTFAKRMHDFGGDA